MRWNDVENGQAEMADAPEEVLDAFSRRTKQMARRIPGAYHLRIPLGTHFVLLERPSVVLPAVRKHLNKVDRPRTGEGKSKAKRTTGSRKSTNRRDSPKARAR